MPEPDLLSSLQPPTLQSVMAPLDTLGQVGVGLAGLGPGPNPFLRGAQEQFRQQIELIRLKHSVEQRRFERVKVVNQLADDALKSPDQTTREFGAKTKGEVLKSLGLEPSPAVLSGYTQRHFTDKEIESAGRYLELFQGDAARASTLSGVPLPVIQELAKNRQSDAYSEIIYGKSRAQRQNEALKLEKTSYDLWQTKHPLTANVEQESHLVAQENFHRPLTDLPDEDRLATIRAAQKNVEARERRKEQRKLQDQLELAKVKSNLAQLKSSVENQQVATLATHGIRLLDRKGNEYGGNPLDRVGDVIVQGFEPVKDAMAKDIRMGKQSFRIFGNMRAQATVLAQRGLLAKTAELYDQVANSSTDYAAAQHGDPGAVERLATYVQFNIGKFTKDPDILAWAGMESEMIISLRNLGEKGIRAMQGFAGAVGVMKGGQFDAIDRYLRNLELITVAQFDKKWEGAFETRYIGKHRKTGATGSLLLRPGEALDLGLYQIIPEFALPPE